MTTNLRYIKHGTPEDTCSSWCRPDQNIHAIITLAEQHDTLQEIEAKATEAGAHFFFKLLEVRPAPEALVWTSEPSYNYNGGTNQPTAPTNDHKFVVLMIQQGEL